MTQSDGSHVMRVEGIACSHLSAPDPFDGAGAVVDGGQQVAGPNLFDGHIAARRQKARAAGRADSEIARLPIASQAGRLKGVLGQIAQTDRLNGFCLKRGLIGVGRKLRRKVYVSVGGLKTTTEIEAVVPSV